MTYKSCRGAAGGMDLPKAYTEGVDNSFDAGALVHLSGLMTLDLAGPTQVYWVLNDGPGETAMPHLYGIADEAAVKMEKTDAGIFNSGHTAATGFFDPKEIYSESGIDGRAFGLNFRTADFVTEYEKYPDDMYKAKIATYMRELEERPPSRQELLEKILAKITEENVKEFFGKLVAKELPDYMLHIYVLRKEKYLDPEQFRQFMPSLRMTYNEILGEGAQIIHVLDEPAPNNVLCYKADNAIDPLWDTKTFPVLCAVADFRRHTSGLLAKVTLYNEADTSVTKVLYAAPSTNGQRKGALEPSSQPPTGWDTSAPFIEVNYRMNLIGEDAAWKLYGALGGGKKYSDLQGIDDIRGILLKWAYRLLGKPYWKKGGHDRLGFGDARNMKFARCVISAESSNADARQAKLDIVDSLKIQSNKHNCDMDTCDPMISFIHTILFGTLTHSYAHCNDGINKGPKGRTTPWKLDEFYREIIRNWGPPKEKKQARQVARVAQETTIVERVEGARMIAAAIDTLAGGRLQDWQPPGQRAVSNSKTQVAPHERGTSKSPRDILGAAMDLSHWLEESNLAEIAGQASTSTEAGLQSIVKSMEDLKAHLIALGVKKR